MDRRLSALLLVGFLALGAALAFASCCDYGKRPNAPVASPRPTLRIYALGAAAGAVEPCGCVKDMLGGVDHLGALMASEEKASGAQLLVAAGPMFLADPNVPEAERAQRTMKAETMAEALGLLGLRAFAPGVNDFGLGAGEFARLTTLTRAFPLAANYAGREGMKTHFILTVGGLKVGLVGVADLQGVEPLARAEKSALEGLAAGAAQARKEGAQVLVALLSMPRGDALRLIEGSSEFQVAIIGKSIEAGEHNDPPFPPELIGQTLVVQAPNHIQGVGVIDLFVQGDSYRFEDGGGLQAQQELSRGKQRLTDLQERLKKAEAPDSGVLPDDLESLKREILGLEAKLHAQKTAPVTSPPGKSYFKYAYVEVRESQGTAPTIEGKIAEYYRRVNDHNKVAFADRLPPPAEPGDATYLGVKSCASCHEEEVRFWQTTQHSRAYKTLSDMNKEYNLDCVSCHVTAYERPGGSTVTHVEGLTDVQCEVCHGPGSKHADSPSDPKLIDIPSRNLCADSCHHPPHVGADWNVSDAWPKIIGPGHGMPAGNP